MTDPNYTELVLVLDQSSSMERLREHTREAVNAFIADQQASKHGRANLKIVVFGSQNNYAVLRDGPVIGMAPLAYDEYKPDGSTALFDAMMRTAFDLGKKLSLMRESERPGKVLFATMTDGDENDSLEYGGHGLGMGSPAWRTATENGRLKVQEMVREQSDRYAWEFLFLGSNIDASRVGTSLGVDAQSTLTYAATPMGTRDAMQALSAAASAFRAGDDIDLTAKAPGKYRATTTSP